MLRKVNELKGFTIGATDDDIGKVIEFYFDDQKWTVRYLVADTGSWLAGRKVLVSPVALRKVDWKEKSIHIALTKEQVEESPNIDTDKPVSRQQETAYSDYYNYPYYWTGPYLWGPASFPRRVIAPRTTGEPRLPRQGAGSDDVHLRSTKEVTGYYIEAKDGDIGNVEDFMMDDENWAIRYIVVDTANWWPGKKVLVSPEWIKDVGWSKSRVSVDLSREGIRNSPELDQAAPISRDYEKRLYEHYERLEHWSR
jgi:hypothetical protein